MHRALLLLTVVFMTGCQAVSSKAFDYAQEAAVAKITQAIDERLESRGLSLQEIKTVVDLDADGTVSKDEVVSTVKAGMTDFVMLQIEKREDAAKEELEKKLAALASVRDIEGLKQVAAEHDVTGRNTWMALATMALGYLAKQVFSAKTDGLRDTEIAKAKETAAHARGLAEKLLQRDLDGDGFIGTPEPGNAVVRPAESPAAT